MISFFRKNLPEKCLALVVAIGCWIFVMNDQNPQIENTYTVPISITNAPEGYQISKDVENVKMRVRAPRSLFSNIDETNFKAYVDLNGVDSGMQELQIQTVLPSGFELVSLGPTKITLNVDKIEQKQVPVRLNLSGIPGDGKVVASVDQSLQDITVEGPVSILNQVTAAVGYIGVNGNTENFSVTVPLIAVNDKDKEIEGIHLLPKTVDVSIILARGLNTKVIDIKPTLMSDLPNDYILKSVRVEPEKIEVSGNIDIIGNMTYLSTENISLAEMSAPTKKTVKLVIPDGVTASVQEAVVTVEITKKDGNTAKTEHEADKT
ncbi:CdaR family protein [Megamonas hypermegale]|uniref:CdaR family protein n=1 Tax=Megamonas hypermegale TaxID=158847 RepID=UPI0025A364F3|nr:CdaR family protein [Megamonas hypermegale]MDM8142721.1 CdaR family protein [Megamonas hypermegale]